MNSLVRLLLALVLGGAETAAPPLRIAAGGGWRARPAWWWRWRQVRRRWRWYARHVVRPGGGTLPAVRRRLHAWSLFPLFRPVSHAVHDHLLLHLLLHVLLRARPRPL